MALDEVDPKVGQIKGRKDFVFLVIKGLAKNSSGFTGRTTRKSSEVSVMNGMLVPTRPRGIC